MSRLVAELKYASRINTLLIGSHTPDFYKCIRFIKYENDKVVKIIDLNSIILSLCSFSYK